MAGGGAAVGGGGVDATPNSMTFLSIAIVMMGAAMFGADQNNYGITYGFKSFQEHWACHAFHFTAAQLTETRDGKVKHYDCSEIGSMQHQPAHWQSFISWGLNLVTAGMMLGALTLGPFLSGTLGRRMTISIGGLMCFFGTALVAWMSHTSIPVYCIGRFVTGFGCGIACMVLPMYNAEVATLNIRGLTGSLFQFMVVIGGVVAVVVLGLVEDWGTGFLIPGYFGIVVGVGAWFCPESPRFLLDRGNVEAGKVALQRVRQGDVTEEFEFLQKCLTEEREIGKVSYLSLFTTPGLRYRLFVACYLQAAQQFTGVNAFLGFQSDIFQSAGYSEDQINKIPGGPTFIVQMVFIVGCSTGLFLVDSPFGGRKVQLLGATLLMGPTLLVAAVTRFMNGDGMIIAIMVFVFCFGFQAAWGIIPWFYPAELFQTKERERAMSISTFCGFLFNLLVGMATKPIFSYSPGLLFMMFGVLNVTNCVFVSVCMRETKGKALEDIPAMFDNPGGFGSRTAPLRAAP